MHRSIFRWHSIMPTVIVTATLILSVGCRDESIVYHEGVPGTRNALAGEKQQSRFQMVAAIIDRPDATWFFKMSGPISSIEDLDDVWSAYLKTIRFDSREPEWQLPENWTSAGFEDKPMPGGSSMRIANVATSDDQVAISVTSMPAGQQLLPNVNRWRGQLGLRPISELQLATQLSESANEQLSFKIFSATGPKLTTRMGGAPFAGSRQSMSPHGKEDAAENDDQKPKTSETTSNDDNVDASIEFAEPENWQSGKTSAMVVGRWSKKTRNGSVELMLMNMIPTERSWNMNVVAWARQVGIEEAPAVDDVTERIEVAGLPARRVQLTGPDVDEAAGSTVLAAMFENENGDGYVLKLSGDRDSVAESEKDFISLLQSIQFSKSSVK